MSWQSDMKERNKSLYEEVHRLLSILDEKDNQLKFLESLVKGPPTIMIACEKVVDAAAEQCKSAVELVRHAKDIYGRR